MINLIPLFSPNKLIRFSDLGHFCNESSKAENKVIKYTISTKSPGIPEIIYAARYVDKPMHSGHVAASATQ